MVSVDRLQHQRAYPGLVRRHEPRPHSRSRRHLPEVLCLSAKSDTPIVARWIASPAPSALRVSHPLSGLIPAYPVTVFQVTSAPRLHGPSELFPSRSAVVPLGTRCSLAIGRSKTHRTSRRRLRSSRSQSPASRQIGKKMPLEALVPELCSNRASVTPCTESTPHEAAALLAFFLFEANQLDRWDYALPSCTCLPASFEKAPAGGAPGCQSGRAWTQLPRESRQPP